MAQLLKKLWSQERGENLSEYAMLLLLLALMVIAGMKGLASAVDSAYMKATTRVIAAGGMESITTDPMGKASPHQSSLTVKPKGVRTTGRKDYPQPPD
ncbi:MAG TPA: hypothetical protein VMW54_14035 [Terriglobia bacterium]|nr:hypothetical protein [Terriglobia bacterium]